MIRVFCEVAIVKHLSPSRALFRMPNQSSAASNARGKTRRGVFPRSFLARALCLGLLVVLAGLLRPSLSDGQSLIALSISPSQPTVGIGGTTQLAATATYADGSSNDVSGSVSWRSADPQVVSVSGSGVASGSATGNAALTASYQGQTATSNGAVL
jgi:hypothetical protein